MFPFWKTVIEPAIRASGARRIVEVGALRGENTELMLDALPADAELHVIDPVPIFDPEEHRARFGPRYVFHQALSLDVLGSIGAFDAALIDGDHNWYTVYNELRALAGHRRSRPARRCRCASCTTWAGPTAGATSTTHPRPSRRSSASPTRSGASTRAGSRSAGAA